MTERYITRGLLPADARAAAIGIRPVVIGLVVGLAAAVDPPSLFDTIKRFLYTDRRDDDPKADA